jgi:hypothetical protein
LDYVGRSGKVRKNVCMKQKKRWKGKRKKQGKEMKWRMYGEAEEYEGLPIGSIRRERKRE